MGNGSEGDGLTHKKENRHYGPSFDAMSWQRGAISQQELGNDPTATRKHAGDGKTKQKKLKHTHRCGCSVWVFFLVAVVGGRG